MRYLLTPAAIDLFSPENLAGYLATAVVAILGFLITWFLLKKLLYKPLMKVSDARTQMVQAGLKANQDEEARLEELEKSLEERRQSYLAEEAEHKKEAEEQIEVEREDMLREAKAKADNITSKAEKNAQRLLREQEAKYQSDVVELSVKLLAVILQNEEAAENKQEEIKDMVKTMLREKG